MNYIFDVDGTLTPARKEMDLSFMAWFIIFECKHPVYLVTGSDRQKTIDQVGLDVYNGLSNVYQLHRANLQILASKYQLDNMKDDISLMVANAYLQIMFNSEILKVQESQLELTKVELLRTQDLIDAGIFSPKQIFEIEANLASQEQSVIQAENNYRNAKLNLAQLLLIDDFESFEIANEDFDVPFSEILDNNPKELSLIHI